MTKKDWIAEAAQRIDDEIRLPSLGNSTSRKPSQERISAIIQDATQQILDETYERFTGRLSDGEDSMYAEILRNVIAGIKKSVVPRSTADPIAQHIDELFRHYGSAEAVMTAIRSHTTLPR